MKVFYPDSSQPPYLLFREPSSNTSANTSFAGPAEEADAAAGFSKRVSSLSSLLLSPTNREGNHARGGASTTNLPSSSSFSRLFQPSTASDNNTDGNTTAPSFFPDASTGPSSAAVVPDWRLRDRMKTVAVGLVLAYNNGTDPPDVVRPRDAAHLQCWSGGGGGGTNTSKSSSVAGQRGDTVAELLEQQYRMWQPGRSTVKYRKCLDPTLPDLREVCIRLRRDAKRDRLLWHYNGHGVPRPTESGEIWIFDKGHAEYIPCSVVDIKEWLGSPSMVVLDCSNAGVLIPHFCSPSNVAATTMEELASQWVRDVIVLCPCSEHELLPMHPDYPADLFTSCLTTPIQMALRWFILHNPALGLDQKVVDHIPGQSADRKTPLGEINWIFQAVTDSIAWNVFPKPLFQRLFRQDLLVASMFRNFLLADRILRGFHCTPQTMPPLPADTSNHILWQAWDLACETLLFQLKHAGVFDSIPDQSPAPTAADDTCSLATAATSDTITKNHPSPQITVSLPFFTEQLAAFEVWLDFSELHQHQRKMQAPGMSQMATPEQLPVVLQGVLNKEVHRVRALELLRRFVGLGPWAINLALCLGINPYITRLLQSPECKSTLVRIWASILNFDPSCRADLCRQGAYLHFSGHLMYGLNCAADVSETQASQERTTAAFILAAACFEYPAGQAECVRLDLHGTCCALLSSYEQGEHHHDRVAVETQLSAHFRLWLCICLANLVKDNSPVQLEAYAAGVAERLRLRLNDPHPHVRAAVCYALGSLIGAAPKRGTQSFQDLTTAGSPQRFSQPPNFLTTMGGPGTPPNMVVAPMMNLSRQLQPTFSGGGSATNLSLSSSDSRSVVWNQRQQHQPSPYMIPSSGLMVSSTSQQQFPNFMNSAQQAASANFLRTGPTVYEDRERLDQDLNALRVLLDAISDASAVVRYEATIAMSSAAEKYLDAFVVVAHEYSGHSAGEVGVDMDAVSPPDGLEPDDISRIRRVWVGLRSLQHRDPFPPIQRAATEIVRVVHESLWQIQRGSNPQYGGLVGIDEGKESSDAMSSHLGEDLLPRATSSITANKTSGIRRTTSELIHSDSSFQQVQPLQPFDSPAHQEDSSYMFPKSEFYEWMKQTFDPNFVIPKDVEPDNDPLSPSGADRAYQQHRNATVRKNSTYISARFLRLAPKPPRRRHNGDDSFAQGDEAALAREEAETTALKRDLQMKGKRSLRREGVHLTKGSDLTSLLEFHPFEPYLVSCCGTDSVSMWGTDTGQLHAQIENGNPKESRMTSSCWLNEESKSMFLVGCNDGTVRVWGDLMEGNGEPCSEAPKLVTGFEAVPMDPGPMESGLIVAWQPLRGTLVAGGSSKMLRCWDLETEKLVNRLETGTDSYITTLTVAWHSDQGRGDVRGSARNSGIGPDIVVAGHSDGLLRVFDIRARNVAATLNDNDLKRRNIFYSEHSSWVVKTELTCYGGKYEVVSGTVTGEIKAWDLRMPTSIRTVQAQRSPMTSFAVHTQIPIVATGAEQFLKLMSVDGEPIQVIRHFDGSPRHAVGPVSCLRFHPHKPLLAAGSTDSNIGVFAADFAIPNSDA